MLIFRSLLFNAVFLISSFVQLILYSPALFFASRRNAIKIPKLWARVTIFLHYLCAGTKCRVLGLENLPKNQPYIIAAKHQSAWETLNLLPFLDNPAIIFKRELGWIPVFGWYLSKTGMIPIDRGSPIKALKTILQRARARVAAGRQIYIFPEGTRKQPGAEADYKIGVVSLYAELKLPVIVIAHNAGLYWPAKNFRRYPGTIEVRILPAIPANLPKKEFLDRLIETTETACDQLLIEAAQSENPPAMPPTAIERLKKYNIDWQGDIRK